MLCCAFNMTTILMEHITFRSMKIFVSFTVFYFLLCYYEAKVSGTALNDQIGDAAADLESKSTGRGEHLKEQLIDPDTYRNVSELIACKGYPLEEHTVVTEDGYILSMQRIPHGKNSHTERGDKEVVLLIHGELGDGKTWFLNPPGQGLGYILPDAGYDVWIINCRGSTYSQKHVEYPKESYRFWDWSFDEIAKYDVSATVDYVLNATGKEALHIIGYSRGNTVGFCLLSEFPEYNKKVKLLVALAPIAYIGHFKTAVRYFIPFKDEIALGINVADHGEFLPTNKATRIITEKFCEVQAAELCQNVLFAVAGQDKKQLNMTRLPIYSAQYPSSTSTRILVHFGQLYESKKFRKYDFGRRRNFKKYNQRCPPDYQPSRITSPVALFTSTNDKIADPTDVDILRKELKSIVFDFCDPDDEYNHFDFIWAKDSHEKIYKPLLGLLSKYVKLLVALAPIAYIGHFKTAVRYFIPFKDEIALGINVADHGEFLPTNKATRIITEKFCEVQDAELCQNVLFAVAGQDKKQLNMTRVPIYSAQYPSSTSTRILVHFGQLYESKKFRKYDFGRRRNLKKYNQRCPPDYQPSRITSPVALFTSTNDKIADPTDVDILRKELKFIVFDFCDPDDEYNHFDFIWAKDSHEKIYKPLLGLLSKY